MLILLVCLTLADIKSNRCDVYCKMKGYNSGEYRKGDCSCSRLFPYEFTEMPHPKGDKANTERKKDNFVDWLD